METTRSHAIRMLRSAEPLVFLLLRSETLLRGAAICSRSCSLRESDQATIDQRSDVVDVAAP
jgi:hypothetical protein